MMQFHWMAVCPNWRLSLSHARLDSSGVLSYAFPRLVELPRHWSKSVALIGLMFLRLDRLCRLGRLRYHLDTISNADTK